MTYLSNRKNWEVELDEIVVTAKRPHSSSPLLKCVSQG